jgi:hypothetical protein
LTFISRDGPLPLTQRYAYALKAVYPGGGKSRFTDVVIEQ